MTQVSGSLKLVTGSPAAVSQVWLRAPKSRVQGTEYVTEAPDTITITGGTVSFDALPGALVMTLVSHGAPMHTVKLLVPDKTSATLAECIEAAELATDGTRSALERLALEVQAELGQVPSLVADALAQDATIIDAVQQASAEVLETKADKTAVSEAIVGIWHPTKSANELRDPTKAHYWSSDAGATGKNLPVNRAGVMKNYRVGYDDSFIAQTYLPFRDPNLYVRYFYQNAPYIAGNTNADGWIRFPSAGAVESLIADAISNLDTGGGGDAIPARSSLTRITCFGDSLTEGYSNGTYWGAEDSYPAALGRELGAGVTVTRRGMSGATSAIINLRAGATPVTFRVPAGTIPGAQWSVIPLETSQKHEQWESGAVTRYGYIGGGYGTLRLADGAWTFTRGETVDDMTADVATFLGEYKNAAGDTIIYGAGRNDITKNESNIYTSPVESIKASVIEMLGFANAEVKQVAFLGTITRTDETPESAGYKQVYEVNDWIRDRYPDRHIDLQGYLTGSQVWTDTGITPTQTDLDAQAQGMTPPSLFDDVTHYSKATAEAIGSSLVAGWLRARGWVV